MYRVIFKIGYVCFGLLLLGCENVETPSYADINVVNERVFIVDRDGKEWEVTHAQNHYGMQARYFQFGVGVNTIPPIMEPEFVIEGQARFPNPDAPFLVIGYEEFVEHRDARAYAVDILYYHEVVNDRIDDTAFAVGY